MAKVQRSVLKQYFQAGDMPTEAQFSLTLDSMVNFVDDRDFIGLRDYNPALNYLPGDCAVFGTQLVKCITATTGVFNPAHWTIISSFGSVTFVSAWDTQNNIPSLASGVGTKGFYYVVTNASSDPNLNTELDGIDDWGTGDWAIFNGTVWQKVDNSEAPVQASNVAFTPTSSISATDVQSAIVEVNTEQTAAVDTKVSKAGDTMTGYLILNANPTDVRGAVTKLYCDTLYAEAEAEISERVNRDGDTMSGDLILSGNPTPALAAVPKQYVDAIAAALQTSVNGKVNKAGDTMTGELVLNADPTNVLGAVTKQYTDAINVTLSAAVASKVSKAGDTMTGPLVLNADPVNALEATTKQYTDTGLNDKVDLAGDTMTGSLILNANPSAALGAATKQYVDAGDASLQSQVNSKVNRSGDTMTGDLLLNADPTAAFGAVTKQYVDAINTALTASVNTKVSKAGDTMTGFLTLNADPTAALHSATKQYVDARVRKLIIPITFDTDFATSSATFTGIPRQVLVPDPSVVFPGATTITAKLAIDYMTESGGTNAQGEAGLTEWTTPTSGSPSLVTGSAVAMAATVNVWTKAVSADPFALTANRSYRVIFRKTVGSGGTRVRIEAASLVLFYS